jgi:hypothetical protein
MKKYYIPQMKILISLLLVTSAILLISCEKSTSDPSLTGGIWTLDRGIISDFSETVEFNKDNTYMIESVITAPRYINMMKGTITGSWERKKDSIFFLNSVVDIPHDTARVNILPGTTGQPIGAFYGYIVTGIFQSDSSLINSGTVRFGELNDRGIFMNPNSGKRKWIIKKNTTDSLIVISGFQTIRYYRNPE